MAKTGRPKGTNNKEVNLTLRLDEATNKHLLRYCELLGITRSEALREAIDAMEVNEDLNLDHSEEGSSEKQDIVVFRNGDLVLDVPVNYEMETVWLTRNQMAELFDRDVKTIGKHISSALSEELDSSTVANFAIVQKEGDRKVQRIVEHYNLDMIISVGYRVRSKRGMEFRKWANSVLKQFLIEGYAVNERRLEALQKTVSIQTKMLAKTLNIEEKDVLTAVLQYTP